MTGLWNKTDARRGNCYTDLVLGACRNPLQFQLTKLDCCCGANLGKGWGKDACEPCPQPGEGDGLRRLKDDLFLSLWDKYGADPSIIQLSSRMASRFYIIILQFTTLLYSWDFINILDSAFNVRIAPAIQALMIRIQMVMKECAAMPQREFDIRSTNAPWSPISVAVVTAWTCQMATCANACQDTPTTALPGRIIVKVGQQH